MTSHDSRPVILWFRRDLRLADNPALSAACRAGRPVIPLYIFDDGLEGRPIGAAARWWRARSLASLGRDLDEIGSRLILRRGEAAGVLEDMIEATGAVEVFCNRLPEPAARAPRLSVPVTSFNAALLAEPASVCTAAGSPYKVFGPFFRALRGRLEAPELHPRPRAIAAPAHWPRHEAPDVFDPPWAAGFEVWTPGEGGAFARLDDFMDKGLNAYPTGRDLPATDGSSRLSPHLHWGEISPWRVISTVQEAARSGDARHDSAEKMITEIGWREFNQHMLAARPDMVSRNFDSRFDRFPWRSDPEGLEAWKRGRTGFPIVDAGMRQLWETGWMHNRVRMITASFLVKDLLIDWREGEAWFWDTLVDADLGNNVGNWQWVAGSGADAAPYFRIFNPETQAKRFDPTGGYVKQWVGAGTCEPIVDHGLARRRALDAFASVRG